MQIRFIRTQPFDAHMNMALDEAISEGVEWGTSPPTIRLYTWNPSAISIGYFQGLYNEVNVDKCKKQGISIVRRQTGGGAVFHEKGSELTYSVILPVDEVKKNIIESYKQITEPIIQGLRTLDIYSEFSPINDIISNGKKISGNAQIRKNGVFLQHGTILYKVDVDKMFSLLTVSKEKMADKLIKSVKKRVTSIYDEDNKITFEDLEKAIEDAFALHYKLEIGNYTVQEIRRAKEIVQEKYGTKAWNEIR